VPLTDVLDVMSPGEMGFTAELHNHLKQMCEKPEEIDRRMAMTEISQPSWSREPVRAVCYWLPI
jgi:hypothetical protein